MDFLINRDDSVYLKHHGIKGQKWGIRRFQDEDGSYTSAGKERYGIGDGKTYDGVNIPNVSRRKSKRYESSTTVVTKTGKEIQIAKKKARDASESEYAIFDNGKKVGEAYLESKGKELYINWIGVNNVSRGQGIANAFMNFTVNTAKAEGYSYLTLEVPDESKDARHIYEKNGFKVTNKGREEDDFWGGLTYMKKEL